MHLTIKYNLYKNFIVLILFSTIMAACAAKKEHPQFDQYMASGNIESAYEYCIKYLKENPDDETFKAHLKQLAKTLFNTAMDEADRQETNMCYLSALDSVARALTYIPNAPKGLKKQKALTSAYDAIRESFDAAVAQYQTGSVLDALNAINTIADQYHFEKDRDDEMDIAGHIEKWHIEGFQSFVDRGQQAFTQGDYQAYLDAFISAVSIMNLAHAPEVVKSDDTAPVQLALAKKYVQADDDFKMAKKRQLSGDMIEMMTYLLKGKDRVPEHKALNQFYDAVLPSWSDNMFTMGNDSLANLRYEDALKHLKLLVTVNPNYPDAQMRFVQARQAYLKKYYLMMAAAYQNARETYNYQQVLDYGDQITKEDPDFLDTAEILTKVSRDAFTLFYQKGIYFKDRNEYAKAIVCFKSAESFLGKNDLTQYLIKEMLSKIRETTLKEISVLPFSQAVGDIRTGKYIASELSAQLDTINKKRNFKNIKLDLSTEKKANHIVRTPYMDDQTFNWSLFKSQGHPQNTLLTGNIKLLDSETSKSTQWHEWRHQKKTYKVNPEFAELSLRQAELFGLLENKKEMAARKTSSSAVKKELNQIQKALKATPQMVMMNEDIVTPYQEETHKIKVDTRLEFQVLRENSGMESDYLWKPIVFEDTMIKEDKVIPPDVNSDDPEKRKGDPLDLPSDYEAKQMALKKIVTTKVIPYLMARLNDYGMRYYHEGSLDNATRSAQLRNYFKFLACYDPAHGSQPELIEKVNTVIENNVANLWLILH